MNLGNVRSLVGVLLSNFSILRRKHIKQGLVLEGAVRNGNLAAEIEGGQRPVDWTRIMIKDQWSNKLMVGLVLHINI